MADNAVEITVRVNDASAPGWAKARRTAEAEGRNSGNAFGRGLQSSLSSVSSAADGAASGLARMGVGAAILGWAPAAAGALTQLAGAALVLPGAMGAAASILGVFKMALSGVSEAISAQAGGGGVAQSGAAAAAAARQIRDAVDQVNDARADAARVAEDSARRIEDAERNASRVAEDGARAVADAKERVREAAEESAEAVADANERLRDTEEQVARQIEGAVRALSRAREQAARSVERTAQAGSRAVERAAERVADALDRERDAQEDLSRARVDAARDLEDLQAKVAGYAVDEQSAQAAVARAAEELRKVNASRRFSDVDRQEAAADLAQAEQRLSDIQREGQRDAAELAKVQAEGVDSTERVQAAAERVADAHDAVVDATADRAQAEQDAAEANAEAARAAAESVADAEQRLADAREDGSRRIEDAQRAVAQAVEDGAKRQAEARAALARVEQDAAQANADAARSLSDARREAAQAQADAAERVADAEQNLADVHAQQREQAAQAAASTDSYAAALAKLSPNAQAFVEQIRALRPEWEALQLAVQDNAFAGMAQTVAELSDTYLPVFREGLLAIATDLNGMAQYAAEALMSPEAVQAVNDVLAFTSQFLQESKTALGDFLVGFMQLMAIGAEYLPGFGAWLADIAARFREWIDTEGGREQIREWIERAATAFGLLWQILQNVWSAVMSVWTALGGEGGGGLLQTLADLSQKLAEVAARKDTQELLQKIGDIARWIFTTMLEWLPQILLVVGALKGMSVAAGLLSTALGIAKGMIDGIRLAKLGWAAAQAVLNVALAANPIGLIVIAIAALAAILIYAWNNSETFRNVVTNAFKTVWDYAVRFVDWCRQKLGTIWDGIKTGAKAAINGAIWALNGLIQAANWAIKAFNALPGPDLPTFGLFPYLARGGIAGGMAVVGEQGPELVKLPQGSTVYPAGQSRGMAERMGGGQQGGGPLEVRFVGNTSDPLATAVMQMIRTGRIQIRQSQLAAG